MHSATQEYIRQHADDDVRQLALQGTKNPEVDLSWALNQIAGRQQARSKLPTWAAIEGIVYPPHLSMEQCSSELTARYKAKILAASRKQESLLEGREALVVDLSAGFGVDLAYISQYYQRAVHVEQQEQLCAISSENYRLLGLNHIEVDCTDGIDYLHRLDHADLIFIDPARRNEHGGRTYGIADCTPNVLEIREELLQKACRVLLKLSPMLDWRKAVNDLGHDCVSEVHIVSVGNECKELLILLKGKTEEKDEGWDDGEKQSLRVVCVNLLPDNSEERFEFDAFTTLPVNTPQLPLLASQYLYEPNASIMKAGCFDELALRYGMSQLSVNSHLFVSDEEKEYFPGRRFLIERVTSMNKRELKSALAGISQANITVRNFPLSVAELRRRLKLSDGGTAYIFATTLNDKRHVLLVCQRI